MPSGFILSVLLCLLWPAALPAQDIGELLGGGTEEEGEQPARKSIDTQTTPATDAAVAKRLRGIYAELEALGGIKVSVSNGVVTLSGTAQSVTAPGRATELAQQIGDVVDVVDETTIDSSLERRFDTTLERWESNLRAGLAALPAVLVAVTLFAVFWWLGRLVAARRTWFRRVTPNGFIAELVAGAFRILVTLIGVVLALSLLDATSIIGTVLGAAGIVGLAVGFAVRDTVENYIASILLSLRQPFAARDLVMINENEGRVARLTSRATILITLDGNHVRIPNAEVYKAIIVNYTRNPKRRFDFTVGVDTDLELQPAQALAVQTVREVPGVLPMPPAMALIEELGDSNVSLKVFCWIDQRGHDWRKVRSEAIRQVKQAFDAAGIVMPEPIYRLKLSPGGASGLLSSGLQGSAPGPADGQPSPPAGRQPVPESASGRRVPAAGTDGRSIDHDDQADTSSDTSVEATLEEEIDAGAEENLLAENTPKE